MAEVRKEERRGGEEELKVGPTNFTVMGTETWRERREAGVGGFRLERCESDLLIGWEIERNESLVASGSVLYCWLRKEPKPK